jgi:hypothetical protein
MQLLTGPRRRNEPVQGDRDGCFPLQAKPSRGSAVILLDDPAADGAREAYVNNIDTAINYKCHHI